MRVLNLYSGLGGNRKYWPGTVTSVEKNEKIANAYIKMYPNDHVIIGDAHQYLLENYMNFDFIWSSPPCQSHSKMVKATRHNVIRYPDMSLYQEIILLKEFFKGKWVVENVNPYYDAMMNPQRIGRHLFWSNFYISQVDEPKMKGFISADKKEDVAKWLGLDYNDSIYYEGNHCPVQVLRNCVHPDIGRHVYECSKLYNHVF